MKRIIISAVLAIVIIGVGFQSCDLRKTVKIQSELDSISYIIGAFEGYQLRASVKQNPEPPINMEALLNGFEIASKGDSVFLGMGLPEAQTFVNTYFQGYQVQMDEKNKAEVDKFLAENQEKSGVVTTQTGLQYKVITEGTGPKPKGDDLVKVDYHGTLLDGSVFDSTKERGNPEEIVVNEVFPGLTEGLLLMSVGSKYILWIPIELGWYNLNHPLRNKFLIFEIELLEIVKQP